MTVFLLTYFNTAVILNHAETQETNMVSLERGAEPSERNNNSVRFQSNRKIWIQEIHH